MIGLHHIGEPLVAKMLTESKKVWEVFADLMKKNDQENFAWQSLDFFHELNYPFFADSMAKVNQIRSSDRKVTLKYIHPIKVPIVRVSDPFSNFCLTYQIVQLLENQKTHH